MARLLQRRLKNTAIQDPCTLASASTIPTSPRKTFPCGIKLLYDPDHSIVDIILVHGLTGGRERTWTAKNAAAPWPQSLLPSKVPNARILTFGYDAYVVNWRGVVSTNRIGNHSMNLLNGIATYRENDDTNNRPIIFVCHSLGGLVCEDALSVARQRPEPHLRNILNYTRGIIFLGTPHNGAGLAKWAKGLAGVIGLLKQTNAQILEVLESDSEILARVQDSFHTMVRSRSQEGLQPIEITCFFEELPLPGIGVVVPSHSAILPGYIRIGIRSNHRNMTKFEHAGDPGFTAIAGELSRWIKELTACEEQVVETELQKSSRQLVVHKSFPFTYLTKGKNHILPNASSYWRHLTVASHEIYEKVYNNCKDHKGRVSFQNFLQQFPVNKIPSRTVEKVWSRLLNDKSCIQNSVYPKGFTMATLYMLHIETFLPVKPRDENEEVGVHPTRRELLKRFGNWVPCRCDGKCGLGWNFGNDIGMHKGGNEKKCRTMKLYRPLSFKDFSVTKEIEFRKLTAEDWQKS